MSLFQCAVGRSAVCDYDIPWSYSLVERKSLLAIQIGSNFYRYMKYTVVYVTLDVALIIYS